ncbi:MAG: hypothetical protein ACLFV7_11400 [Phycisphaerae bacterium]
MTELAQREPSEAVMRPFWGPMGALHALCCLLGLVAGLWPDAVHPAASTRSAVLPTLSAVVVGQGVFLLLVYPLLLLRRQVHGTADPYGRRVTGESVVALLTAAPFYVIGAFLADGTWLDAARVALQVALLFPLAWAAGLWLGRPTARSAVLVAMAVIALGMIASWYIAAEFVPDAPRAILWEAAPLLRLWSLGLGRQEALFVGPIWAWAIWPTLAAVAGLVHLLTRPKRDKEAPTFKPGRE